MTLNNQGKDPRQEEQHALKDKRITAEMSVGPREVPNGIPKRTIRGCSDESCNLATNLRSIRVRPN